MAECNSTMVTSNISSPGYSPCTSLDSSGLLPAVVLSICFLLGFPGNIAVIILKPNWENMSTLSQSLMLNLAVSDLLFMITIPLWIYTFLYGWSFSLVACRLMTYLGYCSVYGSLLTVTVLSIQRYRQVVHLWRSLNEVRARNLLFPLWLITMILSIPALVFQDVVKHHYWRYCEHHYSSDGQRVAVVLTGSLVVFATFSVMAFAYISLYRKLKQAAFFNNPQTTRLIISIIVTLFVLWVPYHVINVLEVAAIFSENEDLLKFCDDNRNIFGGLTFLQSALNPLLYAFTSNHVSTMCQKSAQQFRQKLKIPKICLKSTDNTAEAGSQ